MAEELPTANYIQLPSDIPNSGAGSKREHTNTKDVEVETNDEGTPAGTYTVHEKVFNVGDPIENVQARVLTDAPNDDDPGLVVRATAGHHDRTLNKLLLMLLVEARTTNRLLMKKRGM